MAHSNQTLSPTDIDHFLAKGHVVVRNCFDRAFAQQWTDLAFKRLGYDPNDSSTWREGRVHMPSINRVAIRELAPKAWDALCHLAGGAERIAGDEPAWSDGLICNFGLRADELWQPPSAQCPGWHKDGDFGGLIEQCTDFIELTGEVGDVVVLHPFVLHAASNNPSGRARFITNPPISLKDPMQFKREYPDAYSPVERGVLRGLGVEELDFHITGERQRIVPERIKRQQAMMEEQKKRLAKSAA